MSRLSYYQDALGFDLTQHVPFTKQYRIGCSQCAAAAINGIPTHETGCPNMAHECHECGAVVPGHQRYCEDCR